MHLVLASGNRGKLAELRGLLADLPLTLASLADFTAEAAEETAPTFVENAIAKARFAAQASGLPALADDSGLEVDALGGAPGVRSARFAGPDADDAANRRLLLERLAHVPAGARRARFRCVLVYLRHADDPWPQIFTGTWEGEIALEEAGSHGFGYDPLFWVPARGCTAAQLAPADKALLSHRAQATAALRAFLQDRLAPSHD
ncbi:RdgB/HAM1 family non-canonical purine NTP pyrophosphatase [Immundisolibacter sp.]|uniref:RdgB/HAM1 family non-canonical purine NTP pyrophosphatase n=1 Tax=Immundisolibacter sp. TaxID=1934948 RepID=UPI00262FD44A|nr:RdgB/HAM1 family non-canonical purine NTP pyrophosphatase [Immundisolibacter sp.]MDD3652236.1 RdgB/HAM1 family non-canonical purine NTP pyrophosphatase [Immundisolibacter sp.]